MNAGEVIDRALAEFLHPGDENRPKFHTLNGAINSGALSFSVEDSDSVPKEGVVENERTGELVLVKESSGTTVTLQERAYLGSPASNWNDGDRLNVDPDFSRILLLNHLASVVQRLPQLGVYKEGSTASISVTATGPQALPTGAFKVRSVRYLDGTNYYWLREGVDYEVFRDTDPCQIQFMGSRAATGSTTRINYAGTFTTPDGFDDDLDVSDTLQPYLSMAIAGMALIGKEPTRAQIETIRALMESQNVPVGSILNVGRSLLGMFEQVYVQAERQQLRTKMPSRIVRRRG